MKQLERPLGLYLEQFLTSFPNAISASVDDMARDFMKKALPPLLSDC
jgi:hypothetical protein